ncbi:hypothetical protein QBC40DRAFT_353339 [Triangularia verruculosa]|uniref:Uncharacterized protein n=1 Tax=Triangularia verruculosa TaxID=2587418 RepID=A0AAN6X960_9PEZI|nr:hypothetical protein QBC40DRAFT_353339 [Triangularia verruculosa]
MEDRSPSPIAAPPSRRRVTVSERTKELARNKCLSIWDVDEAEFDLLVPPTRGKHLFRAMKELAEHQPDWEIAKARLKEAGKIRLATFQGKRKISGFVVPDVEKVLSWIRAEQDKMVATPSDSHTDEKIGDFDEKIDDVEEKIDDVEEKIDDAGGLVEDVEEKMDDVDETVDDGEGQADTDDDGDTFDNLRVGIKTEDVPARLNSIVDHINEDPDAEGILQSVLTIASAFPCSVSVAQGSLTDRANTTSISPTAQTVLYPIHFGNVMNRGRWGIAVINMTSTQPITVEIYDTIATDVYPPEVKEKIIETLLELRDAARPRLDALSADIQLRFIPCFNEYFDDPHYTTLSLFTTTMFVLANEKMPEVLDADAYAWLMMTMFRRDAEYDLLASTLGDLLRPQPLRPEPVEDDEEELTRHRSWVKERAEWRANRKEACEVSHGMLDLLTTLESAATGEDSEISQLESILSTARAMMDGEEEFGSLGYPDHVSVKQVLQDRVGQFEWQLEAANSAIQMLQRGRVAVEKLLDRNLPL